VVAFRLPRTGEAPSLWSRTIDRPGGRLWGKAAVAAVVLVLMLAMLAGFWRRRKRRMAK
jgi:quinoprotein glucose dehydrogenase